MRVMKNDGLKRNGNAQGNGFIVTTLGWRLGSRSVSGLRLRLTLC
jgi:hypothetical protein